MVWSVGHGRVRVWGRGCIVGGGTPLGNTSARSGGGRGGGGVEAGGAWGGETCC